MICSGGRGFEGQRGQRFFPFSGSVWAHFLSRAIARKVSFGIFIKHLNLPRLKTAIFHQNTLEAQFGL